MKTPHFIAVLAFSLLSACGSSGGGGGAMIGVFTSSGAVAGLAYSTETRSGVTDSSGRFEYEEGETITFSLGGTVLGETVAAKAGITPFDLVPGAVLYTTYSQVYHATSTLGRNAAERIAFNKFSNILTFLQTLDEDKNPDNGIDINSGIAALLTGIQIDFSMDWNDFEQGDSDIAMFSARAHQAVGQGILDTAVIPSFGVALDQYYSKQLISHNLAIYSVKSNDTDNDGTPNSSTTYTYDASGNLLTDTFVDIGTPTYNYIKTYTYDTNGNRLTYTEDTNSTNDPGVNRSSTNTYDANGNQLTKTFVDIDTPTDNYIYAYTYDTNANRLTYTEDTNSTNAPGVNQSNTYTYDANGNRLTYAYVNVDTPTDNSIRTYTYDANGNRLTYTEDTNSTNDPGVNQSNTYTYDANGNQLTNAYVNVDFAISDYIQTYTFDTNGNELTYTSDSDPTNDLGVNRSSTNTYDANGNQLTDIYVNVDTPTNNSITTYTYDANGNRLTYTRDTNSSNDPGVNQSFTYTYDANGNRLTDTYVNVDTPANNSIATYTYDANGNRLTDARDFNSTNDLGVDFRSTYTWVSSTWAAVLFYIEDD